MNALKTIGIIAIISLIPNLSFSAGAAKNKFQKRSYKTYVPSDLPSTTKVPLIIVLHGAYGNAEAMMKGTFWNQVADMFKVVIAYPQGTEESRGSNSRTWNAGACCGKAAAENVDDIGFLNRLIASYKGEYNIDEEKIYIFGHSNGGMLGAKFVCEQPGVVKSLVIVSGVMLQGSCASNSNLSVYSIHGDEDTHMNLDGNDDQSLGIVYNSMDTTQGIIEDSGAYFESLILDGVGHYMYEVQRAVYDRYSKVLAYMSFLFMQGN